VVDLELTNTLVVAENDHGYQFCVAQNADRWIGFAAGELDDGRRMMFVFPNVADGIRLGLEDRDEAIRLTTAIAAAPENGYGGIARYFVDEDLLGRPEQYRCENCDEVGCLGDCVDWGPESVFDWSDDPESV